VDLIIEWVLRNSDWLGFPAMALIGGAVGHIETVRPWVSSRRCISGLLISWIKALFIAALFYQLHKAVMDWGDADDPSWYTNLALWFFATGLASVFGSETIRTMYQLGKDKITSHARRNGNGRGPNER
jgi:hypothetical protein